MLVNINENKVDIINVFRPIEFTYSRIYCPDGIMHPNSQVTNVINLKQNIDLIYQNYTKNVKNESNKCTKADEPFFEFIDKQDKEMIDDFIHKYSDFAEDKECDVLKNVVNEVYEAHLSFASKNCLVISKAGSKKISDNFLVTHSYLLDKNSKIVRLLTSTSNYRHINPEEKKIIGRLNRLLHCEDIKYFKNLGYDILDFGGVNLIQKEGDGKNVADFKLGFSKKILKYYYIQNPQRNVEKRNRINWFSSKKHSKHKKIMLIYDEKTYHEAVNIVNQLADTYYFEIINIKELNLKKMYNLFDILHDLTNTIQDRKVVHYNSPAYLPYEFFPIKNRKSETPKFVVLNDYKLSKKLGLENVEISNDIELKNPIGRKELNEKLNQFDCAIISSQANYLDIILALGTGNDIIVHSSHKFKIGNVYNNEEEILDLMQSVRDNYNRIASEMMIRIKEIENTYSWFKVSKKYREFYENIKR